MKFVSMFLLSFLVASHSVYANYYCVARPNSTGRSHNLGYGYGETKKEAAAAAIYDCRTRNFSERYCTINYCMPQISN